jgi:enoyl-CoA hydratase
MTPRDTVTVQVNGPVARLALARPKVLNAINETMCRDLAASFDEMEARPEVSIVILSGGTARAFSAGADLTHMRSLAGESLRRFIEQTWFVFDRINRSRLLTIAALHGYALGGGAELALACDLRIADVETRIGFPEMGLGSVPGSGAVQRLPPLVGPARAVELIVSGRHVVGEETERIGLVNKVAPLGESLALANSWADIYGTRPPEAIRYLKTAMRLPSDAAVAPMLHGLISGACQAAEGYREKTQTFANQPDHASKPS